MSVKTSFPFPILSSPFSFPAPPPPQNYRPCAPPTLSSSLPDLLYLPSLGTYSTTHNDRAQDAQKNLPPAQPSPTKARQHGAIT